MPTGYACYPYPGRSPPCQQAVGTVVAVPGVDFVAVGRREFQGPINSSGSAVPWNFEWDGKDAYGRTLQGEQPFKVRRCYRSPAVVYDEASDAFASFAAVQATGATLSWRQGTNLQLDVCNELNGKIGGRDDPARAEIRTKPERNPQRFLA